MESWTVQRFVMAGICGVTGILQIGNVAAEHGSGDAGVGKDASRLSRWYVGVDGRVIDREGERCQPGSRGRR